MHLPCPFNEVRQVVEQAEGVERVTDDLCDGPRHHKEKHTVFTLNLRPRDTAHRDQTVNK